MSDELKCRQCGGLLFDGLQHGCVTVVDEPEYAALRAEVANLQDNLERTANSYQSLGQASSEAIDKLEATIAKLQGELEAAKAIGRTQVGNNDLAWYWNEAIKDKPNLLPSDIRLLCGSVFLLRTELASVNAERDALRENRDAFVKIRELHNLHELIGPVSECGCPSCDLHRKYIFEHKKLQSKADLCDRMGLCLREVIAMPRVEENLAPRGSFGSLLDYSEALLAELEGLE